ncbi:hypothetical protein MIMGU_mgv1a016685mg [Erythranthe guttata]|uniref:Uncharacterized protein n=1 Tax=Erythranthe guttata TaxID=4155 RepID=A0A022PW10_ERYGU|nr:hypothetical protein MIMGU_mgv1a016685mg [Erythranthe guttata]
MLRWHILQSLSLLPEFCFVNSTPQPDPLSRSTTSTEHSDDTVPDDDPLLSCFSSLLLLPSFSATPTISFDSDNRRPPPPLLQLPDSKSISEGLCKVDIFTQTQIMNLHVNAK